MRDCFKHAPRIDRDGRLFSGNARRLDGWLKAANVNPRPRVNNREGGTDLHQW